MSTTSAFPGVHHIAVSVSDLDASRTWYERLLGSGPVLDEDVPSLTGHHKGFHHTLFALPSGLIFALHRHHGPAESPPFDELRPGLDHIGFGCRSRAELELLEKSLDSLGVLHGGIAEDALGYGLAFRDPDGIALEFWAPRP